MHGHKATAKMAFINNYTDSRLHMEIIVHFLKDSFNSVWNAIPNVIPKARYFPNNSSHFMAILNPL